MKTVRDVSSEFTATNNISNPSIVAKLNIKLLVIKFVCNTMSNLNTLSNYTLFTTTLNTYDARGSVIIIKDNTNNANTNIKCQHISLYAKQIRFPSERGHVLDYTTTTDTYLDGFIVAICT